MDFALLVPLLALMALLTGLVSASISKEQTERRRERAGIKKSSLAAGGDSHRTAP